MKLFLKLSLGVVLVVALWLGLTQWIEQAAVFPWPGTHPLAWTIGKGALLALPLVALLYFGLHRPMQLLLQRMDAVVEGQRPPPLPVQGPDEVRQLAVQFNVLAEEVKTAVEERVAVDAVTSELEESNRELRKANAFLSISQWEAGRAQRSAAIGQLAATIAHQIGTPLTALSGHMQLLGEDPQVGMEARKRLRIVEAQIDRASRTIQELLLSTRRPDPALAQVDVNACLDLCVSLLLPEMHRRRVKLVRQLSPDLEMIAADPRQIQDVFCHLIENALDAMPGGGTLTIHSKAVDAALEEKVSGWVAVEIGDTGRGIASEYREQIFKPFFTTKKAVGGMGLGLPIVRETLRSHGGRVTVDSEAGKGARFRLLLPVTEKVAVSRRDFRF